MTAPILAPLRRGLVRTYSHLVSDHVVVGNAVLPAKHLRFGGKEFKKDDYFLQSACREARRLSDKCRLNATTSVLDVGCGVGRLAIGVIQEIGSFGGYHGIDIDPKSIRWCKAHIEKNHPQFQFHLIDVRNSCYRPEGLPLDRSFRIPFEDGSFNIIYLYSVFSHMLPDDIRIYLSEYRRILRVGGTIFMTAFIEEGVPDVVENPPNYHRKWTGPLHCVRFSRDYFSAMIEETGFRISGIDYAQETDGQSGLYLVAREG